MKNQGELMGMSPEHDDCIVNMLKDALHFRDDFKSFLRSFHNVVSGFDHLTLIMTVYDTRTAVIYMYGLKCDIPVDKSTTNKQWADTIDLISLIKAPAGFVSSTLIEIVPCLNGEQVKAGLPLKSLLTPLRKSGLIDRFNPLKLDALFSKYPLVYQANFVV